MFRSQIVISSNDVVLNSDAMLQTWLNGFHYHRDEEKRQEIDRLHQMLPIESSLPLFLAMLLEKAMAI